MLKGLLASAGNVADTGPSDEYFNQVALLLKTSGSDAEDNSSFTDSSTSAHTITASGTPMQGSFSPYQPNGWATYFDGVDDSYSFADHSDWTISTAFTWEFWVNPDAAAGTGASSHSMINHWDGASNQRSIMIRQEASGFMAYLSTNGTAIAKTFTGTSTPVIGKWTHVALTWDGTTYRFYVDGVQEDSYVSSTAPHNSTTTLGVVEPPTGIDRFSGLMSDARFVNGTAVYTGATSFTPPATALTAITNTKLLLCSANRHLDLSTAAHSITITSVPKIVAGGPYLSTVSYDPAVHGGSAYFDGASDYLTVPNHADFQPTTAFTWECWAYPTAAAGTGNSSHHLLSFWNGWTNQSSLTLRQETSAWVAYFSTDGTGFNAITGTTTPVLNAWTHLAYTWDGTTYRLYVNGVHENSVANGTAPYAGTEPFEIGNMSASTALYDTFLGFIADVRVLDDSALYTGTGSFTPPTAPLTAVTNTKLLVSMQDAGIYDATCRGNFACNGDAETDTAEFKFGPSSILFDGTGDHLEIPANDAYLIGTQDFCLEGWVYFAAFANWDLVFDARSTENQAALDIYQSADGILRFYVLGIARMSSAPLSTGVWYHVAVTRQGTNGRMFINGVLADSWTDATSYLNPGVIRIGTNFQETLDMDGQIEDLRLTIGEARYTADFAIPTSNLPTKGN